MTTLSMIVIAFGASLSLASNFVRPQRAQDDAIVISGADDGAKVTLHLPMMVVGCLFGAAGVAGVIISEGWML